MFQNVTEIALQLLLLSISSLGWGFWLHKFSGGKPLKYFTDCLLLGISGFCASILLLQDLVYFGLRLQWTSWGAFFFGLLGFVGILRRARLLKSINRSLIIWLTLGTSVFIYQAAGLIANGPSNYYGNAHEDQINYVNLSQFLIEKPYQTTLDSVGLHPWLIKGIDTKSERIGECIENGYLAVISGVDAKTAYGVSSIVFVSLLSLAVGAVLVDLGCPAILSAIGAIWCGILPSITKTHLDGFFSQTAILFVAPTLLLAAIAAKRTPRLATLSAALCLAFVLSAYTELYIIDVALFALLSLALVEISLRRRASLFLISLAFSIVALAPYVRHDAWAWVIHQYSTAADPNALADLFPNSGTWNGWAEVFFLTGSPSLLAQQRASLLGMLLLIPLIAGFQSKNTARTALLLATLAVPLSALAFLISKPAFPKYPFQKLLITFAPLFVILITLGFARLKIFFHKLYSNIFSRQIFRSRTVSPAPASAIVYSSIAAFTVLSVLGTWGFEKRVINNADILWAVNAPTARNMYKEIAAHSERRYIIKVGHNIVADWLCYAGRHADVYYDSDKIGDRPIAYNQFEFRHIPKDVHSFWLVSDKSIQAFGSRAATPQLVVRNSQGMDQNGELVWYWLGDSMDFEIISFKNGPSIGSLSFKAMAGLANPSLHRVLSLVDLQNQKIVASSFDGESMLHFTLSVNPGFNLYRLRVDEPTEWTVKIPSDMRKHMVRIQEVNFAEAKQNSSPL